MKGVRVDKTRVDADFWIEMSCSKLWDTTVNPKRVYLHKINNTLFDNHLNLNVDGFRCILNKIILYVLSLLFDHSNVS